MLALMLDPRFKGFHPTISYVGCENAIKIWLLNMIYNNNYFYWSIGLQMIIDAKYY